MNYPIITIIKTLVAFAILISLMNCSKKKHCKENTPLNCELLDLSEVYEPVCGCDGVTYQNAGYAQCVGGITKYSEGACDGD